MEALLWDTLVSGQLYLWLPNPSLNSHTKSVFLHPHKGTPVGCVRAQGVGGGGILWISSDGDDQMGTKSKPIRISGPKINSINSKFLVRKHQNDITQKIKTLQIQCLCLYIHHTK